MTLPDPNAAVGVSTEGDVPPPGWTGKLSSAPEDPDHPWAYWYLDVPGTALRLVEAADFVHAEFFPSTGPGVSTPRASRPSHPRGAWRIRQVLLHQTAGATGSAEENEPRHGFAPRAAAVPRNMGRAKNNGRYQFAGMAYHVIIPFHGYVVDGRRVIYKVQDFAVPSGHASTHALATLGVNLQGLLRPGQLRQRDGTRVVSEDPPSEFQMGALEDLIGYLQAYYGIHDSGIQGHFLHNVDARPACPGYDAERWALERQDRAAEGAAEGAFCYPIALPESGGQDPAYLPRLARRDPEGNLQRDAGARARALELAQGYLEQSESQPGGSYPFGRRPLWHDGLHLFPRAEGEPVRCVREGWIVAAGLGRRIRFRGLDHGSACFVLVQHADSACPDADRIYDWRARSDRRSRPDKHSSPRRHMAVCYYSLYMHLQPLDEMSSEPAWLAELDRRDATLSARARAGESICLGDLALPVRTAEVIGATGCVDPFVSAAGEDLATQRTPLLHFELFSHQNLVAIFEDEQLAAGLSLEAPRRETRPWVAPSLRELPAGLSDAERERLATRRREADALDPHQELAQLTPQTRDPSLNHALSKLIARHVSEWAADWSRIPEEVWAGADPEQWNTERALWDEFCADYLPQVQWLKQLFEADPWPFADALAWMTQLGDVLPSGRVVPYRRGHRNPWPGDHSFYYFHPLRLLNWLNGLERAPLHPAPYYGGGAERETGVIHSRHLAWRWSAGLPWTEALPTPPDEAPEFYVAQLHETASAPRRLKRRPRGVVAVFAEEASAESSAVQHGAWAKPDGTFESWAYLPPDDEATWAYRRVLRLGLDETRVVADCATRADALALVGGDEDRIQVRAS